MSGTPTPERIAERESISAFLRARAYECLVAADRCAAEGQLTASNTFRRLARVREDDANAIEAGLHRRGQSCGG